MFRGKPFLFAKPYTAFYPHYLIYLPKKFIFDENPRKNTSAQILINSIMELKKSNDQNSQMKMPLINIKESLCEMALSNVFLQLNEKNDLKLLLNNALNTIKQNDFNNFSSIFSFIIRNHFDFFQEINENMLNLAISNVKNSDKLNEFLVANYFITMSKACKTRFFSKELWKILNEKILNSSFTNYNEYSDDSLISIFFSYCEVYNNKKDENLTNLKIIKKICNSLHFRSNNFNFNKWKDYLKSLSTLSNFSIFVEEKEELIFYEKLWHNMNLKNLELQPKNIILAFHYMIKIGVSLDFDLINLLLEKIWLFKNEIKKNQDIAILLAALTKIQFFEEFQTNITKIYEFFYSKIEKEFSVCNYKSKIDFFYSFCNSNYRNEKLMDLMLMHIPLNSLLKYNQLIGNFILDLKKKYPQNFEKQKPIILNFLKKNPSVFNYQNFGSIIFAFIEENDQELFNLFKKKISQIIMSQTYLYLPEYMNYFDALSTKRDFPYKQKDIFLKCIKFLHLTKSFIKDTKIKKNEFYFHTIVNFYKNNLHKKLESESRDLFFQKFFECIRQEKFLKLASQKQIYLICETLIQISENYQEKIKNCLEDPILNKDLKDILERIINDSLKK